MARAEIPRVKEESVQGSSTLFDRYYEQHWSEGGLGSWVKGSDLNAFRITAELVGGEKAKSIAPLTALAAAACARQAALEAQSNSLKSLIEAKWGTKVLLLGSGTCDFRFSEVIPQPNARRDGEGRLCTQLGVEDPAHKDGNLASSVVNHKGDKVGFSFG